MSQEAPLLSSLSERLRGIYRLGVNDGAGPLNGSDTFTREFVTPPVQREAADEIDRLNQLVAELQAKLNTPELHDFAAGAVMEAAHQRERWGSEQDAGKSPADWFWLVGFLAGKALQAAVLGNLEKALHHTISAAAALANWHAALSGANTVMRPGIIPPEGAA